MARIEDANKHLDQLNTLYLSTIETLAMAIDAKDQITHGHIRRVQRYAVVLAKEIGITDELQLRAIAAAALLHDMGKLAVPEYILNKPGALTPAEFERMKLHASVGADILSSIDFPYPVVPIVRHHHENWDGGGYPSGLKGADIPIGARVLSVVDCFDALTSDRPYRPRLSDEDALQVVRERRGSMYDPLIVDAFLNMYRQIKNDDSFGETEAKSVTRRLTFSAEEVSLPRLAAISASAGESRAMYRLIQRLAGQQSFTMAIADIVQEVSTLIPATVVAFYSPTGDSELEATQVAGSHVDWLRGRRVKVGERIVGWSASSGRSVLNADAQGEFGELARTGPSPLRSCLTVPVVVETERLGVLAAFSTQDSGFRDEDQRMVEAVIRHIAPVLERLRPHESGATMDLPRPQSLELTPVGMIACRCRPSSAAGTESVGIALAVIRRHLGSHALTQIIHVNDIFVGIGISGIAEIQSLAEGLRGTLSTSDLIQSVTHVAFATAPKDGTNLEHLIYACRQRLAPHTPQAPRIH
jgi:putative nucleotidyltransferase with HDIG domain